nr:retrovirus-related Pol polyprotein from transposon TNT 1-94 [Tanacetum cinerariifolium]
MFQPVFDEFFSPSASVASLVPVEEASAPVESTSSPSSTTVDQDAPSPSTSQTTPESQTQTIPLRAKEESHDLEVAHMSNDPYFGILIPKIVSEESSSLDVIPPTVYSDALISKHLNNPNHMYILKKSLYGLKQAPRALYDLLSSFLLSQGFSKGTVDPTLFIIKKAKISSNMNPISTQQVALDNALVPPEKRLKIERCNARIAFSKPQREETYQVSLEALKLSPCYPPFVITVEVCSV